MSAIASFTKLPKSALAGVRSCCAQEAFFGGLRDTYEEYLQRHGREVAEYRWSGFVLATLLPYLQEKHQIDLMKSDYNELGTFLTSARGATHFILTASQNAAFSQQLDPRLFSEEEMERYFNEFNETNEQGIGRAMLDGIAAFRAILTSLDDQSVIVFRIA